MENADKMEFVKNLLTSTTVYIEGFQSPFNGVRTQILLKVLRIRKIMTCHVTSFCRTKTRYIAATCKDVTMFLICMKNGQDNNFRS